MAKTRERTRRPRKELEWERRVFPSWTRMMVPIRCMCSGWKHCGIAIIWCGMMGYPPSPPPPKRSETPRHTATIPLSFLPRPSYQNVTQTTGLVRPPITISFPSLHRRERTRRWTPAARRQRDGCDHFVALARHGPLSCVCRTQPQRRPPACPPTPILSLFLPPLPLVYETMPHP